MSVVTLRPSPSHLYGGTSPSVSAQNSTTFRSSKPDLAAHKWNVVSEISQVPGFATDTSVQLGVVKTINNKAREMLDIPHDSSGFIDSRLHGVHSALEAYGRAAMSGDADPGLESVHSLLDVSDAILHSVDQRQNRDAPKVDDANLSHFDTADYGTRNPVGSSMFLRDTAPSFRQKVIDADLLTRWPRVDEQSRAGLMRQLGRLSLPQASDNSAPSSIIVVVVKKSSQPQSTRSAGSGMSLNDVVQLAQQFARETKVPGTSTFTPSSGRAVPVSWVGTRAPQHSHYGDRTGYSNRPTSFAMNMPQSTVSVF